MLDETRPFRDQRGGPRGRLRLAALLALCVPVVAACSGVDSAKDRVATQLAQGLREAHERGLSERAADPTSRDQAAADRLGRAVSGGNAAVVIAANETPIGVEVVITLGALAEAGGGLSFERTTLGACVRTRATPGSATGDVGERGTVETQAVPCPDGVVPVVESVPVQAVTTDLQPRRSDVPRPGSSGCLSGSDECVGG